MSLVPERVPILDRLVWFTFWGGLFAGSLGGMMVLGHRALEAWPSGTVAVVGALSCIVLGLGVHLSLRKLVQGAPRAFLFRTGAYVVDGVFNGLLELALCCALGMIARWLWSLLPA
jgi:hypothetical protein